VPRRDAQDLLTMLQDRLLDGHLVERLPRW
jgi:hypothetical protein